MKQSCACAQGNYFFPVIKAEEENEEEESKNEEEEEEDKEEEEEDQEVEEESKDKEEEKEEVEEEEEEITSTVQTSTAMQQSCTCGPCKAIVSFLCIRMGRKRRRRSRVLPTKWFCTIWLIATSFGCGEFK